MKTAVKLLSVLAFLSVIIAGCEKQTNDGPDNTSTLKLGENELALLESNNDFGLTLFQALYDSSDKEKNLFISPLSVAYALAMTYNGADGTTKTAMENTLKLSGLSMDEINTSFKSLMEALIGLDEKVLLEIANSIWYKEDFYVEPDFITVNQEYYDAEVSSLDFSSPNAVETINNWVSEKTHEKIPEILDYIPPDAVMYLINAIYFKGTWKYEFDELKTVELPFYLEDGTPVSCPTMAQQSEFFYTQNDLFQAIELPYGKEDYSMVILLPDASKKVEDVMDALDNQKWDEWMKGLSVKEEVVVYLPKLLVKYEEELKKSLSALGMSVAFSPEADFTKINPDRDLFISRVKHKTFLEVNEEGSEAAAVTLVEILETSTGGDDDNPIVFRADRPFILAIRERSTNTILFIGVINNPNVTE